MSRVILAVMAGLLCALAGIRHAAALKNEANRLGRWHQLLLHLALLLQECTLTLPQALMQAADGTHKPDQLLRDLAAQLNHDPLTSLQDAFGKLSEECAEKPLLHRMFSRLGRGTVESRVQVVRQAAEEVSLMHVQASAKATKDVKLYQTLGIIGGTCLTILLL